MKYKVKQKVVISNYEYIYPDYEIWITEHAFPYHETWLQTSRNKTVSNNSKGEIIAVGKHGNDRDNIYLVKTNDLILIIDERGLERNNDV